MRLVPTGHHSKCVAAPQGRQEASSPRPRRATTASHRWAEPQRRTLEASPPARRPARSTPAHPHRAASARRGSAASAASRGQQGRTRGSDSHHARADEFRRQPPSLVLRPFRQHRHRSMRHPCLRRRLQATQRSQPPAVPRLQRARGLRRGAPRARGKASGSAASSERSSPAQPTVGGPARPLPAFERPPWLLRRSSPHLRAPRPHSRALSRGACSLRPPPAALRVQKLPLGPPLPRANRSPRCALPAARPRRLLFSPLWLRALRVPPRQPGPRASRAPPRYQAARQELQPPQQFAVLVP